MESTNLLEYFSNDRFEVIQKEGRVWVNDSSGLIGRFNSRTGIDIHFAGVCIDCRSGQQDFDTFVLATIDRHNIDLSLLFNKK